MSKKESDADKKAREDYKKKQDADRAAAKKADKEKKDKEAAKKAEAAKAAKKSYKELSVSECEKLAQGADSKQKAVDGIVKEALRLYRKEFHSIQPLLAYCKQYEKHS